MAVLRARDVILSPDNDAKGLSHMAGLAARLDGAQSVRWLDPSGWLPGGDLADALGPGLSARVLHDMVVSGRGLSVDDEVWPELDARIGDLPRSLDGPDKRDETSARHGSVPLVPHPVADMASDEQEPWGPIDPLLPDLPLPPFPLHALPTWMSAMVEAVAANTETDPCMAAVTALGLTSAPLSNRFVVLTPIWMERGLNLFVASIADSGELKSAVFAALDEPIRRHERDTLAEQAPDRRDRDRDRRDSETRLGVAREELKKAMKAEVAARAAIGQGPEDQTVDGGVADEDVAAVTAAQRAVAAARDHVHAIERELEADEEEQRAPYALLADDSTQEALQRQMAQQDGRVAIVSAESELLPMAAGRYADNVANLQVYLSGFSGEPLRAERITREVPPVHHPGLSVVVSVQPVVMEEARRNAYLARRGLLARFMYAVPRSRAGDRHLAGRPSLPVSVEREYREVLMRLCRIGDAQSSMAPVQLRLLGEAARALEEWHDARLEPRRDRANGDLGATEEMAAWAARLHGLMVRVAGILHVAEHLEEAASVTIEPATVAKAIEVAEWAAEHAFAAFGVDRLDRVGHDAVRLRAWYGKSADVTASFTVRDACRALRGLDAERVRGALSRLAEHGYVRIARPRSGSSGGRPSDIVTINPVDRLMPADVAHGSRPADRTDGTEASESSVPSVPSSSPFVTSRISPDAARDGAQALPLWPMSPDPPLT